MSNDIYSMTRTNMQRDFDRQRNSVAVGAPIGVYVVDDIGGEGANYSLFRAVELLQNFDHAAELAIGSALKYAIRSGKAFAAQTIRKHYFIKSSSFKRYAKTKYRQYLGGAELYIYGQHIPLITFQTSVGKNGVVRTRVKRSSSGTKLDHVFVQQVGKKHLGLFERVTDKRYPIEEKFGPSIPQMFSANEDLEQETGDLICDTFEKRIDHEILAILNGTRNVNSTLRERWYGK